MEKVAEGIASAWAEEEEATLPANESQLQDCSAISIPFLHPVFGLYIGLHFGFNVGRLKLHGGFHFLTLLSHIEIYFDLKKHTSINTSTNLAFRCSRKLAGSSMRSTLLKLLCQRSFTLIQVK